MDAEWIALLVSVVAIGASVYIAKENRRHALAAEEYFKLQQVAEKIVATILNLQFQYKKYMVYFELSYKAAQEERLKFIDSNDTLNKSEVEKQTMTVASLIEIYFNDLGKDWDDIIDALGKIFQIIVLIDAGDNLDWKAKAISFNEAAIQLGDKPKKISDAVKQHLEDFRNEHLKTSLNFPHCQCCCCS